MNAALQVESLEVAFTRRGRPAIRAVDDVSLTVAPGRTLGLVGESGSGKTTVGRAVVGLQAPTSGRILIDGHVVTPARTPDQRRHVQMIFQDPMASLDPRQRAVDAVGEPLRIQARMRRHAARQAAREILHTVGLNDELSWRFPHQLSGGQRQRVVIARAMALEPSLTVCDEPVSALDVSVQAQVINLLADLQRARAVSYLFIAHDLAVVRHLAHDVAVMHLGRVVESGPAADVYERARHPYTIALLSAVLTTGPEAGRPERIVLRGEMPSPAAPPPGCTFHTRCFRYVELGEPALCRSDAPPLAGAPGDAHHAACHFPIETPVLLGATPTAAVTATGTPAAATSATDDERTIR